MKNKRVILVIILITLTVLNVILYKNKISNNQREIIKEMTQSENEASLQTQIDQLNLAHEEYAQNVQSYKKQIAEAITNQGVSVSENATASVMAENIGKILQARTSDATATADNITAGKTAYINGSKVTGTMVFNNSEPVLIKHGASSAPIAYEYTAVDSGYVIIDSSTWTNKSVTFSVTKNEETISSSSSLTVGNDRNRYSQIWLISVQKGDIIKASIFGTEETVSAFYLNMYFV